jgi:hypothetical protein
MMIGEPSRKSFFFYSAEMYALLSPASMAALA